MLCDHTLVTTRKKTSMIRTYSDLRKLESFEERFDYLALSGSVGDVTFGYDRPLNQMFYTSPQWRRIRHHVILRDEGADLGIEERMIRKNLVIHHMNPMTLEDILHDEDYILDPEFLITTTHTTHNAIHYGNGRLLPRLTASREPGDTRLW